MVGTIPPAGTGVVGGVSVLFGLSAPGVRNSDSRWRQRAARARLALIAATGLLLLTGCGELPQTIMQPAGDDARLVQGLLMPILWIALVIFVLIEGFLIFSMIKYRRRPGNEDIPKQVHGNNRLELLWTAIPAAIVLVIAVMTFKTMAVQAEAPGEGALVVEVSASQWWWEFSYPELGVVTANELYLPIGREIDLRVRANDVIHSFWIPKLAGKIDVVPGIENRMKFVAEKIGRYQGQCSEFCGIAHAQMRLLAFVVTTVEFEEWAEKQLTGPSAEAAASAGAGIFAAQCAACHSIQGTAFTFGQIGPELTGMGLRETLGAGTVANTPENLADWIREPTAVKPGALMPALGLVEDDISAVVAYLEGLR